MVLYRYVKSPPESFIARGLLARKRHTVISFVLMAMGGAVLLWAVWPIMSFAVVSDTLFSGIIAPVPDLTRDARTGAPLSPIVLAADNAEASGFAAVDFTNANVWFPMAPQKKVVTPVNSYTISIPKLGITGATVMIGGDDLSEHLIHYGGTGLPGDYGNAVIFGHSTLPQFFNANNYKTIFSTLPTLKTGDKILVLYDGIRYQYEVYDMTVNDPSDLSALEQRFDDSYITLVTCVPPGTYWKRLYVKAKLVRL